MLASLMTPALTFAATPSAPARAANAKSVSLRLADVLHVLGGGLKAGEARFEKPVSLVCPSTPAITEYHSNFDGPVGTKGVLVAISDIYTYRSAAGPRCLHKSEMSMNKVLGNTIGRMTIVHGVGEQAFLLDTTGPKTKLAPVYTLGLNFTRGSYRANILVQSNRTIKASDMIKLGQIVDERMKHTR
jgi:hypothetical protein